MDDDDQRVTREDMLALVTMPEPLRRWAERNDLRGEALAPLRAAARRLIDRLGYLLHLRVDRWRAARNGCDLGALCAEIATALHADAARHADAAGSLLPLAEEAERIAWECAAVDARLPALPYLAVRPLSSVPGLPEEDD